MTNFISIGKEKFEFFNKLFICDSSLIIILYIIYNKKKLLDGRPNVNHWAEARACKWKWLCTLTSLYRAFVNFYDV